MSKDRHLNQVATSLMKKIEELTTLKITVTDNIINNLQIINNDLSSLLKNYGTESLEDLLLICFGNNNKITTNENEYHKFELLKKYFHPTSYKLLGSKKENEKSNKGEEPQLNEKSKNLYSRA